MCKVTNIALRCQIYSVSQWWWAPVIPRSREMERINQLAEQKITFVVRIHFRRFHVNKVYSDEESDFLLPLSANTPVWLNRNAGQCEKLSTQLGRYT